MQLQIWSERSAIRWFVLCVLVLSVLGCISPQSVQAAGEIIVRDDDQGATERGGDAKGFTGVNGWIVSNGHATYTYSNSFAQPDNYLKWKPPLNACGQWEVFAFIPSVNNNVSDTNHAVYQVRHRVGSQAGGATDSVVVDQGSYDQPGLTADMRWHSLGIFTFSSGADAVGEYVLLGDNTGEGTVGSNQRSVNFDDVKWVYRGENSAACGGGAGVSDVTVADSNDSHGERGGTASSLYDAPAGSVTGSGHATWTGSNINTPDNYVKWKPPLPVCGDWEVLAFIPWINNQMSDTSHASYAIRHRLLRVPAGEETTRILDMDAINRSFGSTRTDRWYSLGTYTFSMNADAAGEYVRLGDTTGEGGPNQRSVNFDDMRWVYRGANGDACGGASGPGADTTLPEGALLEPADGAKIGPSNLRLSASASDNVGVNRVEFHAQYDGIWHQIAVVDHSPYETTWNMPFGLTSQPIIFTIHVIDQAGNTAIDPGGYHTVQYLAPAVDVNVVHEARADVGMPYRVYRGCPTADGRPDAYGRNNYGAGCGRPYHGFDTGICTDLVMDAYNAGLGFNIDDQIHKDAAWWMNLLRYRYKSARNAEDMRRYFLYNQQLLSNNVAYKPGDVGFFDWGQRDGIADHVLIIAAVDTNGRPSEVVDNPSSYQGRPTNTLVHPWNSGYDAASMGHGRLGSPTVAGSDGSIQEAASRVLVIESDSPALQLRLHDSAGRMRGAAYNEDLVASNIQEFIPYIPASTYETLSDRVVLRAAEKLATDTEYVLEASAVSAGTYHLTVRVVQDGTTLASQEQVLTLGANAAERMRVAIGDNSRTLTVEGVQQSAWIEAAADVVTTTMLTNASAEVPVEIAERSGTVDGTVVGVQVSDLVSPSGRRIASTAITLTTNGVVVPAGGMQAINLSIASGDAVPDMYRGGVTITLDNGTRQLVPLQVGVAAGFSVYLPSVSR